MTITTFGNPTTHHLSINKEVFGPFSNKLEMIEYAHSKGVYFHKMENTEVEQPVQNMYYTLWTMKND